MREILFRGKEKLTGKWREGSLLKYPNAATIKRIYGDRVFQVSTFDIILETVGQYTGLTDKNGRKIFEGDIVSGHLDDLFPEDESIYKVVWDDYGWHIKNSTGMDTFEQGWAKQYFEVIGNIYDNPELMERMTRNE